MPSTHTSRLSRAMCNRLNIALLLSAGACIAFGFMEWLFFYTKPSFMATLTPYNVVTLAIIPSLWLFLGCSVLVVALNLLPVPRGLRGRMPLIVPTFLLGSLLILMLDNFTYTVLTWGTIGSEGIGQFALVALYLLLLHVSFQFFLTKSADYQKTPARFPLLLISGVMGTGVIMMVGMIFSGWSIPQEVVSPTDDPIRRPNIIFFAADGVEARLTSAYGYHLDTTPALKQLTSKSLVFANAFSTSSKTTGAVTSILTGIQPLQSKVGFPPQTLSGRKAFRHLPAILRRLGYSGFQGGVEYFVDSGTQNLQQSFDMVNGRKLWNPAPDSTEGKLAYIFSDQVYFFNLMTDRLLRRLKHMFGIQKATNHFQWVSQNEGVDWEKDRKTVSNLIDFVQNTDRPFFAHLHLMGTHCCLRKDARAQLVSEIPGPETLETYAEIWERRYINTIRDSDDHLAFLLRELAALGKLDNTILVVSSDHSRRWSTFQRIPLVISFPDQEHTGVVHDNVQLTDIAPTVLDYMRIEKPDWMTGRSLTSSEAHQDQPLVTIETFRYVAHTLKDGFAVQVDNPGPPSFGVAEVGFIVCDIAKRVSLDTGEIVSHKISGHTRPCPTRPAPDDNWVRRYVKTLLDANGFNTALQNSILAN